MAVDGTDLFVANKTDRSVTELDASDGTVRTVLSGSHYKFVQPSALAVAGPDLFVASAGTGGGRGSVTEVDIATGDLVTVLSGSGYKFDGPGQMALSGQDLFVANNFGQSVTELDASNGGAGGGPVELAVPLRPTGSPRGGRARPVRG